MTPAVPRPLLTPVTATRSPGLKTSPTLISLPTAGGSPSARRNSRSTAKAPVPALVKCPASAFGRRCALAGAKPSWAAA